MSSSPNQWYVQTDFGALLRRDQVREGPDGAWRMASDWPSLFEEAALKHHQPDTLQEPASPRESF